MPTQVFEEPLELEIYAVESVPLSPNGEDDQWHAYPYTRLRPTDQLREFSTLAVVVDNPFLRVTILPDLGGRIFSIFDKRIDKEILPQRKPLRAEEVDGRGAWLRNGIQLSIDNKPFANSMARVSWLTLQADNDEAAAGVWLSQCSGPISFSAFIGLPGERAEVLVEARVFNRTLDWCTAASGLTIDADREAWNQGNTTVWYSEGRDCGMGIDVDRSLMPGRTLQDGILTVSRFESSVEEFGPRQLDTWSVRLLPFGGIGRPSLITSNVAMHVGDELRIVSFEPLPAHKLFLLTEDGKTLEAPADLRPEQPLVSKIPTASRAVAIRNSSGVELLRYEKSEKPEMLGELSDFRQPKRSSRQKCYRMGVHALLLGENPAGYVTRAAFEPGLKSPCFTVEGLYKLSQQDYSAAAAAFEEALSFNAEDHLAWWYKALAHRLAGDVNDERQELLNAHYLAPLEPALRAESFLGMDHQYAKEPSTIVAPMAQQPEQLIEVACLLLEARLYAEATRWIDEALRHQDLPMLRYLLAFAYLSASRMEVEAAEQLRRAAAAPLGPPYPWRMIESHALQRLAKRFPDDTRLAEYLNLMKLAGCVLPL